MEIEQDILNQLAPVPDLPKGRYAMWWSTPEQPNFLASPTFQAIERFYQALDGFESYAFTSILATLGDTPSEGRYGLPDSLFIQPLRGPEDRLFALSASAEKGLRFHFSIEQTPIAYRDQMWEYFAEFAEVSRRVLLAQEVPADPGSDAAPQEWWEAASQVASRMELSGEPVQTFGVVIL